MSQASELPARTGPGAPPRSYEPETAARICELLANGDKSLSALLDADRSLPCWRTVCSWEDENPSFEQALARARKAYLKRLSDQALEIADSTEDATSSVSVRSADLRIKTRQWLLAKLMPDTYGDKLDLTSKGEAIAAPSHTIDARIQSIVLTAQRRQLAAGGQVDALPDEARGLLE